MEFDTEDPSLVQYCKSTHDSNLLNVTFISELVLPHLAPSWILSLAENLASFSLQDGARIGTIIIGPASQPATYFEFCAVSPPQCEHLNTFSCAVSPPWFWVLCGVMCGVPPPFWIVCSVKTYSYVRCPPHINPRIISCVPTPVLIFDMIPSSGMSI